MLNKSNIEEFINLIIANVELFQLFKRLNTLYILKFTPSNMQKPNILKRRSNITKTWNYGIIQFEVFKRREDFTRDLQIVEMGVHSEFNFGQ